MSRLIGAVGIMGVIGGVWLLLAYLGVIEGQEEGQTGVLLLAVVFLLLGIPSLAYRIKDIFGS